MNKPKEGNPLSWVDDEDFWGFLDEDNQVEESEIVEEKQHELQVSPIGDIEPTNRDIDEEFEIICRRIESSFHTLVKETGSSLKELRDTRIYLNQYDTFEECVQYRFGLGKRQAYRLIEGAEIASLLPEENQYTLLGCLLPIPPSTAGCGDIDPRKLHVYNKWPRDPSD